MGVKVVTSKEGIMGQSVFDTEDKISKSNAELKRLQADNEERLKELLSKYNITEEKEIASILENFKKIQQEKVDNG